jgi:hypothetical protein
VINHRHLVTSFAIVAIGVVLLATGGCEAPPAEAQPQIVTHAMLEHDPMHEVNAAGWWSDGVQLLHLDPDHGYRRFGSLNPYRTPVERGWWTQDGYAVLWLEPYDTREPERIRVSIRRAGAVLSIVRPKARPMFPIDAPPPMLEDRLFGTWVSDTGVLHLGRDLAYTFSPETPGAVGHRGSWLTSDQAVLLMPDSGGDGPYRLEVAVASDDVRLVSPEGAFVRGRQGRD